MANVRSQCLWEYSKWIFRCIVRLCPRSTFIFISDLDVSSEGVVGEVLTPVVAVAGGLHLSVDEDVPGEQSHLCTHVHSVHNLAHVSKLRLPWNTHTHNPLLENAKVSTLLSWKPSCVRLYCKLWVWYLNTSWASLFIWYVTLTYHRKRITHRHPKHPKYIPGDSGDCQALPLYWWSPHPFPVSEEGGVYVSSQQCISLLPWRTLLPPFPPFINLFLDTIWKLSPTLCPSGVNWKESR